MKKDLTRIFLDAAQTIDRLPSDLDHYSCHFIARAEGFDVLWRWQKSRVARFYFHSAGGGGRAWQYDLWDLPDEEMKAVRVFLLCLMAVAWRDLPRKEYGL